MKIKDLVPEYLRHLKITGRSYYTQRGAIYGLKDFIKFLSEENVFTLENLNKEIMEEYQQDLAFRLTSKGRLLAVRSQSKLLSVAKMFTRFLKNQDYMFFDPGEKIKMPKEPKRLPKVILNTEDIILLMQNQNMQTNQGYRDRIILELLYDTAIRRAEISNIKIADTDLRAGYLKVTGKGDKERVVPLSHRVCELVGNYIMLIRPAFLKNGDNDWLILNKDGGRMDVHGIWAVVKRCAKHAGIKKNVSTHTFRHTCATHMLKNGAPIRHIQEMLGHESLESTQIYTHVTINDLKEVHSKYHPGGKGETPCQ